MKEETGFKKVKKSNQGHILREGEVTGHAHRVIEDIDLFKNESTGEMKLITKVPFKVTHEEHDTLVVEEIGEMTVDTIQEYDHFLEESRAVLD